MGDLVFGVDSHRKCLNRRHVQIVDLSNVFVGIFEPVPRSPKSEVSNDEQRDDHTECGKVNSTSRIDEQHRYGCTPKIVEAQPSEVLSPEVERRSPTFESERDCNQ